MLPSKHSDKPENDRIKDEILSTVKNHQEISQNRIIENVRKKISPKPDPKTIINRIKEMCRDEKLHELCDRSPKKRAIGYVTADYCMDETIYEQMKDNLKKIRTLFDEIESDSSRYPYQLMQEVNGILEGVLSRTPELIKSRKDYLELQLESWEPEISEKNRSIMKLLDEHKSNQRYPELTPILHNIRKELYNLDNRRINYFKQLQKAASAAKREKIVKMIGKVSDTFSYWFSSLCEIENMVKSKDPDSAYEDLVRKYPQNEPNNVQRIFNMLDRYPPELQFKLEDLARHIINDLSFSVDAQKALHTEFEAEEDKNRLDYIEEQLVMEEDKKRMCEDLLDKICQGMESDKTIKQILAEMPKEYVAGSRK